MHMYCLKFAYFVIYLLPLRRIIIAYLNLLIYFPFTVCP